jgi:hypothetical protein
MGTPELDEIPTMEAELDDMRMLIERPARDLSNRDMSTQFRSLLCKVIIRMPGSDAWAASGLFPDSLRIHAAASPDIR